MLDLMECLAQGVSYRVYMDNYLTSFRLLAHLGEHNIHATGVLNKKKLAKCDITIWSHNCAQVGKSLRNIFFLIL